MTNGNGFQFRHLHFFLWGLVAFACIGAVSLFAWSMARNNDQLSGKPLGMSGKPFVMHTTDGQHFTEHDLAGIPTLLYFGYTFCPDVCPTTLAEIADWKSELQLGPDKLRVIMVTVDPERDTPENLRLYLDAFSTEFIGLVGSVEETEKMKDAFGVFSEKVITDDATDYLVDHTASVFLTGRDGAFESIISFGEERQSALAKIQRVIDAQ